MRFKGRNIGRETEEEITGDTAGKTAEETEGKN